MSKYIVEVRAKSSSCYVYQSEVTFGDMQSALEFYRACKLNKPLSDWPEVKNLNDIANIDAISIERVDKIEPQINVFKDVKDNKNFKVCEPLDCKYGHEKGRKFFAEAYDIQDDENFWLSFYDYDSSYSYQVSNGVCEYLYSIVQVAQVQKEQKELEIKQLEEIEEQIRKLTEKADELRGNINVEISS